MASKRTVLAERGASRLCGKVVAADGASQDEVA